MEMFDIEDALKASPLFLQQYVTELKAEILKLQKQNAKLQVKNVSCQHRISALEDEIQELHNNHPTPKDLSDLSDEELDSQIEEHTRKCASALGYELIKIPENRDD